MTMICVRSTIAATSAWELGHLGTCWGGGATIFYFFSDEADTLVLGTSLYLAISDKLIKSNNLP